MDDKYSIDNKSIMNVINSHGNSKGRTKRTMLRFHPVYHMAATVSLKEKESFSDFIHEAIFQRIRTNNPAAINEFKLEDIRNELLDKHLTIDGSPVPRWASGLPKRIAIALLKYGYSGRVRIKIDVSEGVDFTNIKGLSATDHSLIVAWSKN